MDAILLVLVLVGIVVTLLMKSQPASKSWYPVYLDGSAVNHFAMASRLYFRVPNTVKTEDLPSGTIIAPTEDADMAEDASSFEARQHAMRSVKLLMQYDVIGSFENEFVQQVTALSAFDASCA